MSSAKAPQQSARRAPHSEHKTRQPAAEPAAADLRSLQQAAADPLLASPGQLLALQRAIGNQAVQRLVDGAMQRSAPVGREGGEVGQELQAQLESARGGGQPIDNSVGAPIGQALGADFSGVRVHTDTQADGLNRSLGARAFTLGSDIFFSQGAYNPGSSSGQELLAHELTHVVQQGGGQANRVQGKLTVGPAGDGYEQEADRIAKHAIRHLESGAGLPAVPDSWQSPVAPPTIRRMPGQLLIQRKYEEIIDRFKPGDLLYGLAGPRSQIVHPVKQKLEALGGGDAAAALDELNNYFLGTEGTSIMVPVEQKAEYGQKVEGYKPSGGVSSQALEFKAWLEKHPRYSPLLREIRGKPLSDRARIWARIKQACKAGLEYTTTVKGAHIFFILDGLNWSDVTNKIRFDKLQGDPEKWKEGEGRDKVDPATGDSVKDITPSEIRWVYRNRNNPAVMNHISFWEGEDETDPPWLTHADEWGEYQPKSEIPPRPKKPWYAPVRDKIKKLFSE